jgi:large subunit ribosomal protein L21
MYAIVETGGKQYRVRPGDTIAVERLAGAPGETLDLTSVLLLGGDGSQTRVGAPSVVGAVVRAEVVDHARGEKIIVFRYKSKVRYRRKTGHRQELTHLRITDILLDGESAAATTAAVTSAEPQPAAHTTPQFETALAPETGTPAEALTTEALATSGEAGPAPEPHAEA